MGYGRRRRIGLLVPSSNTTMEAELYRISPGDVSVHAARMRLEDVTQEKLVQMAEDAERAATLLATAGVDVVVYGSASYPGVTPHPGVGGGNSLERKPANRDTDDCSADFWERYTPNPGLVTLD